METNKVFLGSLFDFSFSEFITIKVIKVIYFLMIIISALFAIGLIITGFNESGGAGVFAMIISPIIFLLYVLFSRVWLEIIVVVFRIGENTTRLVEMEKESSPPAGG